MNDNEKLIEEARRWPRGRGVIPSAAPGELIPRLADALEAAEKAHTPTGHAKESDTSTERVNNGADSSHVTPTDDEREALANQYVSTRGDSQTRADFLAGWDAARRRSESDAEIDAAARAMFAITNQLSMSGARDLARAALRAAGGVR